MRSNIGLVFSLVILLFSINVQAVTRIDITKGNADPLPIALNKFEDNGSDNLGSLIVQVVKSDLERSGLFRAIDDRSFIDKPKYNETPKFISWRQINATGLLIGEVNSSSYEVSVNFRLFDVFAENQIAGRNFKADRTSWRRIAHMISDEIYKSLTGEDGYFDTRIVYVSEMGPATNRIKRLAIMDQDSENHHYLTDGKSMALTPRFSPKMQQVMYLSFAGRTPRVYLRDIESGRERVLGDFNGMTFAPRFSPDGTKAIFSLARNGMTDVIVMDLGSMDTEQLTSNNAINTSPSFSPDGKKVVFNSDRAGKPHIYVMNADGSNQQRISFGNGTYGNPVWSPRGDLISFTKILGGEFYIGVMKVDGSAERLLTKGYLVEGQTWSPNGRVLIYTRQERAQKGQTGRSKLYSIDLTGFNEREISTPLDASDGAWSPLL